MKKFWKFGLSAVLTASLLVACNEEKDEEAGVQQGQEEGTEITAALTVTLADADTTNRQGPRLAEGVESLAKVVYPEVFE